MTNDGCTGIFFVYGVRKSLYGLISEDVLRRETSYFSSLFKRLYVELILIAENDSRARFAYDVSLFVINDILHRERRELFIHLACEVFLYAQALHVQVVLQHSSPCHSQTLDALLEVLLCSLQLRILI